MKRLLFNILFMVSWIISLQAQYATQMRETTENIFEDFENITGSGSGNYEGHEVTFASGVWYIKGITTMTASDRHNGIRSIRLKGSNPDIDHRAEMMFDKPNGAGTVSFKYGSFSNHANGVLQLQLSTDQGVTWIDQGEPVTVPSWVDGGSVLQTATITVNQSGNIRIRILKISAPGNTTVNIDDIEITDFDASTPNISVSPTNLAFGNIAIQTVSDEKTLTVTGYNLTGNITYNKTGDDATAFTVIQTSWNPATGGTLSVTFSPTEARTYNASIVFSSNGAADRTVTLSGTGVIAFDNFFEDFENMSGSGSGNYLGKEITFASGVWYIKGITNMDAGDRYNGIRSIRLKGSNSDIDHRAEMLFDKPNGIGTVSFKYASYSNHSGGVLQLQISTDQGNTWIDKGDPITVPSWENGGNVLQTAQIDVNTDGDIRIRIIKTNAKTNSNVNIDDIEITDFGVAMPSISVSPTNLAFGDVIIKTVSDEKTLSVTGYNLVGNITYTKDGDDAAAFTITQTSWNPTSGGTLTIVFAPTEIKPYNATITFSSNGATPKTVTISGTGVSGNITCNEGFEEWTNGKPNCWWGDKTTFSKAAVAEYNADVHSGNAACQLINPASDHKRFSTQPITVVAEKEYIITFWVRGKGDIRTVLFDAREGNNGYSRYNEWISIDSDIYEQYTQTVTATTYATNAEFIFSIRNTAESSDHIQLDDVEIYTPNDITEISASQFIIYPNPTSGTLIINSEQLTMNNEQLTMNNGEYHIYNVIGQMVMQGSGELICSPACSSMSINVTSLPSGIYFLRLGGKTVKFVRE